MFRCRDAFLRETPRCLKVFRHTCHKDGSPSCIGNAVVLPSARFDLCSRPKPFRSRHPPPLSLLPHYPASLEKEQGFPTKKGALSRPRSLSLSAQLLRSVELAPRPRPSAVALRPRGRRGFPRSRRRSSKRLRRDGNSIPRKDAHEIPARGSVEGKFRTARQALFAASRPEACLGAVSPAPGCSTGVRNGFFNEVLIIMKICVLIQCECNQ